MLLDAIVEVVINRAADYDLNHLHDRLQLATIKNAKVRWVREEMNLLTTTIVVKMTAV